MKKLKKWGKNFLWLFGIEFNDDKTTGINSRLPQDTFQSRSKQLPGKYSLPWLNPFQYKTRDY